jgi:DNA-binding helix-hairpin-helix protein with protein kinase domain
MNELLRPGDVVETIYSGQPCRVEAFLGGGGQGEVYRAGWSGGQFALKWYFPHTATKEQRGALERLVQRHLCPSGSFLWPLDLAQSKNVRGFGYLMPLRERRFKSLFDLVARRIDPTFEALAAAALGLVESFQKLHAEGLCYRDISLGNAFLDPQTGEVLVCDNDNVAENRSQVTGVLGTPDFMAPELVRMDKGALPSRQTDLFSLAVLLFYMFCNSHPLVGRRILSIRSWDYPARKKMFGHEPLFIFDPQDRSNEAVARLEDPYGEAGVNAQEMWPLYPASLRGLFTKAFTSGLSDPEHGRVTEGEWIHALATLRDALLVCTCQSENFFDPSESDAKGQYSKPCWSCGNVPALPFRLRVGTLVVVLNSHTRLFGHHLNDHADLSDTAPVAEIARHPTDPKVWGLKNLTESKWIATPLGGAAKEVPPGKSIVLAKGTKIDFGRQSGEIMA